MCNTATRAEVYSAIDSERDYQENLIRSEFKYQTPMEYRAIMNRILRDQEDHWYDESGQVPLDFMRKIAGVAVRAMEQYGAPMRGVTTEMKKGPVSRTEVYAAIDSERTYHGTRNFKYHTPMDELAVIEDILAQMRHDYYDRGPVPALMDYFRKIAGVAVRAMEVHGAPRRVPAPDPCDALKNMGNNISEHIRKGSFLDPVNETA